MAHSVADKHGNHDRHAACPVNGLIDMGRSDPTAQIVGWWAGCPCRQSRLYRLTIADTIGNIQSLDSRPDCLLIAPDELP